MLSTGVELPTVSSHLLDVSRSYCSQAQIGPFVGLRSLDGTQRSNIQLDVAHVDLDARQFELAGVINGTESQTQHEPG
jgi:hypothetical protein